MSKQYLVISGYLQVPKEEKLLSELVALAQAGVLPWFRMQADPHSQGVMNLKVVEDVISPGEEEDFLDFLQELGQKFEGKISGEFEVWWPMAVQSGPQWWSLEPNGVLYVTESDIVRGEKLPYKEKNR